MERHGILDRQQSFDLGSVRGTGDGNDDSIQESNGARCRDLPILRVVHARMHGAPATKPGQDRIAARRQRDETKIDLCQIPGCLIERAEERFAFRAILAVEDDHPVATFENVSMLNEIDEWERLPVPRFWVNDHLSSERVHGYARVANLGGLPQ